MLRKYVPRKLIGMYFLSLAITCLLSFSVFRFIFTLPKQPIVCPRPSNFREITLNSVDEIAFITVPRPFMNGDIFERNKLAIHSWLSVSNSSRVLLFVNRSEYDPSGEFPNLLDKLYGPDRVKYLGYIKSDLNEVPYIDHWFIRGLQETESKYVCFINADIVLSSTWLHRVKQVFQSMKNKNVVMIGQRIDFDLRKEKLSTLNYGSKDFLKEIDRFVMDSYHEDHSPYGIDTFTFRADNPPFNPEMIPPFIMGRYNWDNWLVGWLNTICDTVTFNLDPPIYHVNHERHNFDPEDNRVAVNDRLRKANRNFFGSNYDTNWEIKDGKICSRLLPIRYDLPKIED
ncbi:hypothetical protein TVAG_237510 [Trichomonas vaginalis G3]|uniref:Uncharacterized protein n=1 Tax=Trichomonas vaginalis (strain ATCC PRA-98 / G3) TaxID=412133 RepID=A2DCV1_TRIV3|nr:nucleotide-diphospho-sugar transferases family [Trichomonas vaginalis G3]EAY21725.1 hypothetical protein TVAG_237510 [Trichomonas vaginalis G3]KAI5524302.1 nucleotide-diphospho-sugar transferases family [Trichomonas vaginalis G3]|eukprot:XP_001582711.1 hypothetical protein [Trichomonas vaginalis G3]